MNTTKLIFNHWFDYFFKLDSTKHLDNTGLITFTKISLALASFKEKLFSDSILSNYILLDSFNSSVPRVPHALRPTGLKLLILFKINTKNNQMRSISYMQTIKRHASRALRHTPPPQPRTPPPSAKVDAFGAWG
jgi:hypothetical protein